MDKLVIIVSVVIFCLVPQKHIQCSVLPTMKNSRSRINMPWIFSKTPQTDKSTGRIFWGFVGDFIMNTDWLPLEFNVPDIVLGIGNGIGNFWNMITGGQQNNKKNPVGNVEKDHYEDSEDDEYDEDDEEDDEDDEVVDDVQDDESISIDETEAENDDIVIGDPDPESVEVPIYTSQIKTKKKPIKKETPVWIVVLKKNINDIDIDNIKKDEIKVIKNKLPQEESLKDTNYDDHDENKINDNYIDGHNDYNIDNDENMTYDDKIFNDDDISYEYSSGGYS